MSAIFGIIYKEGHNIEQSTINTLSLSLKHRAVDGSGIYHSENVMMGHYKLITNIHQKNEQLPFEDADFVITADARIDNRDELIRHLEINQKTSTIYDTLIILQAYKKWGNQCTDHLLGEFAFVIWHKRDKTIFAATDHIGFRSFYYYHTKELFIFSSEIKGILACKPSPSIFNKDIIAEYFTMNYSGATFDKDIYALKGASQLVLGNDFRLNIHVYWTLQPQGNYSFKKDEDWAACLNELLTQSVQNRLNTDLPVGVCLSGGLDSSFVSAIAATILQKKNKAIYTFSNVLPEGHKGDEGDEKYFINLMGEKYKNIQQTFVDLPLDVGPLTNFEDTFEKTEVLCYPFIYVDKALYAAAKNKNVSTLLTGFGGDFTISNSGNDMIYELFLNGEFSKALNCFSGMKKNGNLSIMRYFKSAILDQSPLSKVYQPVLNLFKTRNTLPLCDELNKLIALKSHFGTKESGRKGLQTIIGSGIIGGILYNTNKKLGAGYNLDVTVPILDKSINEFFFDVPPEQFILKGQNRSLMRRAMKGMVPEEIQQRVDKSPFSPDFSRRFIQQEKYMQYILTAEKFETARKYINKKKLSEIINHSLSSSTSNLQIKREVMWCLPLILFLNSLKEKKYSI